MQIFIRFQLWIHKSLSEMSPLCYPIQYLVSWLQTEVFCVPFY